MALKFSLTDGAGRRETRVLAAGTLSIGRSERNDWVLPDPERHLSKVHCVIGVEGDRYVLTDLSANGVHINGARQPTSRDSRVTLTDGDTFRLGDYTITVEEVAAISQVAAPDGTSRHGGDPLDIDPLDEPLGRPPDPSFAHPIAHVPTAHRQEDPFDRIDEAQRRPGRSNDLFAGDKPVANWVGPTQPDHADGPRHAMAAPRSVSPANPPGLDFDALDALMGDLSPLQPATGAPKSVPLAPPPPQPRARDQLAELDDPLMPSASGLPPSETPAQPWGAAGAPSARPSHARTPAPPIEDEGPLAGSPEAMQVALRAFLKGAGVPQAAPLAEDPEAALRHIGQVFRALTEGVREVLMSRAAIKGELRIEQTLLKSANNNALKFSFSTEDAVIALLAKGRPGYMPPLAATREAFDDIKMHELAVMAGVQTALMTLLHRFDPQELEGRLAQGMIANVLPATRKARLWDRFRDLYKTIATESEDDFQAVFGRGFAKAYKAQIRKE